MKNKKKVFNNIISTAIMAIAIIALVVVYNKYNYNDFVKSVQTREKTTFTRDREIKCSKMDSYKIESNDYNNAMFYKTIAVTPNTPYKISCKVKVKDVENKNNTKNGGAHICIMEDAEASIMINGTQDWQEISLLFNSKNRDKINIGFKLGGYQEESKGTAWFSDFKLEAGSAQNNGNWKFGCFIFPKIDVDVNVNGKTEHVYLKMSDNDVQDLKNDMDRVKDTIAIMSKNKMRIDYDLLVINEPIKTLSYDEDNGYYVSPEDVYDYINSYVVKNEYDHIYVCIRMADVQAGNTLLINDWIGLGSMEYSGIGYSNIRLPDDSDNIAYKFNYNYNTFPEEVYIHEFLHTLERNSKAYGYDVPDLHDYEKYGYKKEKMNRQKDWYIAYMNKEINYNGEKIGLPAEIYNYKPVHESNFKYSIELDSLKEPQNVIEVIRSLFNRVSRLFNYNKE